MVLKRAEAGSLDAEIEKRAQRISGGQTAYGVICGVAAHGMAASCSFRHPAATPLVCRHY